MQREKYSQDKKDIDLLKNELTIVIPTLKRGGGNREGIRRII